MWVKALSASTPRSKQSLIVETHWKKKKNGEEEKNTATVYGAAIEMGGGERERERGGEIRLKMCESLEFGELRGQKSGKGRVDKSVSEL